MSVKNILNAAWLRPFVLLIMLVVIWDLAIRIFQIPQYLIPRPLDVIEQMWLEGPMLLSESLVTTYATLGGFAMSVVFGIPVAMLIAYSRTVESYVYPLLV